MDRQWQDRYCRKASEYEVFITYFSCDTVFVLKEYSTMSTYTALRIPCIAFFLTLNYGQCLRICKKVIKQQHCSGRVNHPVKKGEKKIACWGRFWSPDKNPMICSATSEMLSDFYRHKIPNLWCTVCSEPSYFSLKAAFKFLLAYAVACQQMYSR